MSNNVVEQSAFGALSDNADMHGWLLGSLIKQSLAQDVVPVYINQDLHSFCTHENVYKLLGVRGDGVLVSCRVCVECENSEALELRDTYDLEIHFPQWELALLAAGYQQYDLGEF